MSELIANLDRLTVLELGELLRGAAHALDLKLDQITAAVRPPVVTTRVATSTADMGEIFDSIGGSNELSRIDAIAATGGFPVVRPSPGK